MRRYFSGLLFVGFLCACGGIAKEPAQRTSSVQQQSIIVPVLGDQCEIEDPGGKSFDTCLPDQTGLHCCLAGPGYYGFCYEADFCV